MSVQALLLGEMEYCFQGFLRYCRNYIFVVGSGLQRQSVTRYSDACRTCQGHRALA